MCLGFKKLRRKFKLKIPDLNIPTLKKNQTFYLNQVKVILFFSILVVIAGRANLDLPGGTGIKSNFAEVAILMSLPFLKTPIAAIIMSLFTFFNIAPEGSWPEMANHVVGVIFLYYAYPFLRRISKLLPFILAWIVTIGIYYYLILLPVIFLLYIFLGDISFIEAVESYVQLSPHVVYEFVTTTAISIMYFIFRRENEKRLIIQEQTETLKIAMTQIHEQQKLKSLNMLVIGIAHEINTPLGTSISACSIQNSLIKTIEDDLELPQVPIRTQQHIHPQTTEQNINDLKTTTQLLERNLNNIDQLIQKFKLIDMDQNIEKKSIINVKEHIEATIFYFNHINKMNQYEVFVKCPENLNIISYPNDMTEIFFNLLSNSIQHGFVEEEKGKILIHVRLDKGALHIQFEDTGVGIENGLLTKIFEPFFTTNRSFGGHGLGLYVVNNIVTTKLNGTISCESELNKGCKFLIAFPVEIH